LNQFDNFCSNDMEDEMFRFRTVAFVPAVVVCAAVVLSLEAIQPGDETQTTVPRAAAKEGAVPDAQPKAIPTPAAGEWGIISSGIGGGGIFRDADSEAEARLGTLSTGVNGYGAVSGGYFQNSVDTGLARLGWGDVGIAAGGDLTGALFAHSSGEPYAWAAYTRASGTDIRGDNNSGEYGIFAGGLYAAAYFEQTMDGSMAYIARGETGVEGWGSNAGGIFRNTDESSGVILGKENKGIEARGDGSGGYFEDTHNSGAYADVATGTYKIIGTGTPSFIQNHPIDPDAVIVYSTPEGDEVATYTRGTARLVDGEARVPLGETFKWVTNPDIGLTAHLTPRGEPVPLAAVELSTEEMVVRAPEGARDGIVFDYLVFGLRIGFEESTVVQEKRQEAFIPSMKDHRVLAARRPDLAGFTALSRWTQQSKAAGLDAPVDLARAHNLRDAIQEYDEAVHGPLTVPAPDVRESNAWRDSGTIDPSNRRYERTVDPRRSRAMSAHGESASRFVQPELERDVRARSFQPSANELASLFGVSERVEPGDVLAMDPEHPGHLRLAAGLADPTVVGVVADSPGVLLGAAGSHGHANRAAVALSGVAACKVDASYGPVYPGDLLVTSPTAGHAMRGDAPLPGTVLGKALEEVPSGTATIPVLVMLR
jgi:hypothetical protein